jgi:hypothetical protein
VLVHVTVADRDTLNLSGGRRSKRRNGEETGLHVDDDIGAGVEESCYRPAESDEGLEVKVLE